MGESSDKEHSNNDNDDGDDNRIVKSSRDHLPICSAHETAHDSTDEPGVVPVGQIIPSTGPMAADRRCDVARMMTALDNSSSRSAPLRCWTRPKRDTNNARPSTGNRTRLSGRTHDLLKGLLPTGLTP